MSTLLQIDFPYNGPFGEAMAEAFRPLAESIAQEKGLIWKIWTENPTTHEAGGIYLFEDEDSAHHYLTMHTQRLNSFGILEIRSKIFQPNEGLTLITKGALA